MEIRKHIKSPIVVLLLAMFFLVALPIMGLVAGGMEHLAHVLVISILLVYWYRSVSDSPSPSNALIGLLSVLSVSIRYESIFLLSALACISLFKGNPKIAVYSILPPAVFIILFGLFLRMNGHSYMPDSVLAKGLETGTMVQNIIIRIKEWPYKIYHSSMLRNMLLISVVIIGFDLHAKRKFTWNRITSINSVFILTALAHTFFAEVGWFHRYQAWLIGLGLLVITFSIAPDRRILVDNLFKSRIVGMAAIIISCLILISGLYPKLRNFTRVVPACREIFSQQVQMARFINKYFSGTPVFINDIGAVSFYTQVPFFDVWGLAEHDFLMQLKRESPTQELYNKYARQRGIRIAVIYRSHVENFPESWLTIAKWQTPDPPVVAACSRMDFVSVDTAWSKRLYESIKDFERMLPGDVRVLYRFHESQEK
jgi:hypothetical protein